METYIVTSEPKRLIRRALWLVVFIFIVNLAAMQFFWYWSLWWFDIPMHFLGGAFLGLVALYLYLRRTQGIVTSIGVLGTVLGFAFVLGLGWELFEFGIDTFVTFGPHNLLDTASDLCFDLAGALAVLGYAKAKDFI